MSPDERPVGEDDLQAFVDGRLSADRAALVRSFHAAHPEEAAAGAADLEIRERIRARLLPLATSPVPSRLRVANILAVRRERWRRRSLTAAAALLCLTIGGSGGWIARDRTLAPVLPSAPLSAAMAAFKTYTVEIAHPVEVRADQEGHLVQWLSRRLDRAVIVPDLSSLGFRLMGGRLLPGDAQPAALLMYDDDRGQRLVLYSRPGGASAQPGVFRVAHETDVDAISWTKADQTYVVAARLDAGRLRAVAHAAEAQIAGPTDRKS